MHSSTRFERARRALIAAGAAAAVLAAAGCASSSKTRTPPAESGSAHAPAATAPAHRGLPTGAAVAFTFGETGERIGQFRSPEAVTVDLQGNIFVAERLNNRVQKFDRNGHYLIQFGSLGEGPTQFNYPIALSAQQGLYLYVLDAQNERLLKFDLNGNLSGTVLDFDDDRMRSQAGIVRPRGFTVDRTGNVYVTERERDRVLAFNPFLEFRFAIGSSGRGLGALSDPRGVVATESGDLYVADSGNGRVSVFSTLGGYQTAIPLPPGSAPRGLARDAAGVLYVADPPGNRVLVLGPHGEVAFTITDAGDARLDNPTDVTVDDQGRVYVADTGHDRVVVYDLQYGGR